MEGCGGGVEMSTVLSLQLRSQHRQTVWLEPYEMANIQPAFGPQPSTLTSGSDSKVSTKQDGGGERLSGRIRAGTSEQSASRDLKVLKEVDCSGAESQPAKPARLEGSKGS